MNIVKFAENELNYNLNCYQKSLLEHLQNYPGGLVLDDRPLKKFGCEVVQVIEAYVQYYKVSV